MSYLVLLIKEENMTMTGYFNESATAKCPTKAYFPFLQWMLDVPNLVKSLCKSKQNMKNGLQLLFIRVYHKSQAFAL